MFILGSKKSLTAKLSSRLLKNLDRERITPGLMKPLYPLGHTAHNTFITEVSYF